MQSNKLLNRAIALAFATMSTMVGAVSLGDLTVESRPGEPMQATLRIDDLDLTISPLLVRVAPPSTYLRAGITWPQQVQDLHLVRDSSGSLVQVKVVGKLPVPAGSFPLLIELNAGGKISVRNYQIVATGGRFEVLEGTFAPSPADSSVVRRDAAQVQSAIAASAASTVASGAAPVTAVATGAAKGTASTIPTETSAEATKTVTTAIKSTPEHATPAPQVLSTKLATQKQKSESTEPKLSALEAAAEPRSEVRTLKAEHAEHVIQKAAKLDKASKKDEAAKVQSAKKRQSAPSETIASSGVKRVHRAPEIVREYVALNGFDATQPFHVQHHMTLWSVAKLYWPSYRGATLEQLLVAFRNRNPEGFEKGDPDVLLSGTKLVPPSEHEVFEIDALTAFREIHGAKTPVPPPTQNLIDAQKISNTLAGNVADAQDRERTEGRGEKDIERAGRETLESGRHLIAQSEAALESTGSEVVQNAGAVAAAVAAANAQKTSATEREKNTQSEKASAALEPKSETSTSSEAPMASAALSEPSATSHDSSSAQASAESAAQPLEQKRAEEVASHMSAAEVLTEAAQKAALAAKSVEHAVESGIEPAKEKVDAAIAAVKETTEKVARVKDEAEVASEIRTEAALAAQKAAESAAEVDAKMTDRIAHRASDTTASSEQAPAAAPAQSSASASAGHDEPTAVWWAAIAAAALFLIGWFFKTRRREQDDESEQNPRRQGVLVQSDVKPASSAQLLAVEKTVDEAVKNGTTAGAMGVGSMAYSEALQEELRVAAEHTVEGASLERKARIAETKNSSQPWLEPDDEMPPLEPHPTMSEQELKASADRAGQLINSVSLNLDDPVEGAERAEPAPKQSAPSVNNKEAALQAALEAKYNLAKSFVTMGALAEALELLDEVRRRGTPELRARAADLAATIPIPAEPKEK